MKKNYRFYIFSGILIFHLGCETKISDYDIKTFAVTQIDNNACEQFYNYNLEKTITTTDLDTVYNDLDSLYAFILGDTSSLLNINNSHFSFYLSFFLYDFDIIYDCRRSNKSIFVSKKINV